MPAVPINFGPMQESGQEQLAGASPVALNATIDSKGAVRRRPCLQTSTLATSTVVDSRGICGLYVAADGTIFAMGGAGASSPAELFQVGPSAATSIYAGLWLKALPTFAETEAIVVTTGDNTRIFRTNVASPYTTTALGGSPPLGTQVVANSSRLLINDPSVNGRINYSAPAVGGATAGHEQWGVAITANGQSGFFAAEARTDDVVALRENTNEVFAFGETSTQVFAPDPTFIYSPVSTKEYGCASATSVIKDEQAFAWFDHRRRIVYSDGRSFQTISDPIKAQVDGFSTVSDCFGYRVLLGPVDALVWTLPTEGVTLAYQKEIGWGQWASWDPATNNYSKLGITAAAEGPNNRMLVGTDTGQVLELSRDAHTDNGAVVPFSVTTGFINHGTDARKTCKALYLTLKRGQSATEMRATVEYRDGLGPWSAFREVGLGVTGDTQVVVQLRGLGSYRRRQWRFTFYGESELILASAVESVEVRGY